MVKDSLADMCISLRSQGRAKGASWLSHERLGYNYRLSDINCALGIVQLSRIDEIKAKRKQVAKWYQEMLSGDDRLIVPDEQKGCEISWFVFVVRLKEQKAINNRTGILDAMKSAGIQVSNYFPPVHLQPFMMEKFGFTVNSKGFRVLPSCIRVIQGDGVNSESIKQILDEMERRKLSTENIAFGMGGGLLQDFNRDTLRFAMKCSAIEIGGKWRDVSKSPVTDKAKHSKKGRLALVKDKKGDYATVRLEDIKDGRENFLKTVFENGKVTKKYSFAEVRKRAGEGLGKLLSERK